MNNFVKAAMTTIVETVTDNGAKALKSTLNALVNLFGMIGALRLMPEHEIIANFDAAWRENPLLALKMVFHTRNIRGGMGERRTARTIFRHLAITAPETMKKNLMLIPAFGRWDDLYCFVGTPLEAAAFELMKTQFDADMQAVEKFEQTGEKTEISLLGKWLKSCNTSAFLSRELGQKTAKAFSMREKEYRNSLTRLRKYLNVVESKISANDWADIYYAGVTSKAMMNYRNAFAKHDPERFNAYLESLRKGETKINSGTLFPYEILERYHTYCGYNNCECGDYDEVLEEQWKALPNYLTSENNVLVMADTSGSMEGRPLMTSLSLALYFAERNRGDYKNIFMTFDRHPAFVTVEGNTLKEKIENIRSINVANTDIEAAFNLVLDTAIKGNVPKEDMPKAFVIVSDMQFDRASKDEFYYDLFADKFAEAGYEMPSIVFWNVNAATPVFHATSDVKGVQMASGSSPSLFKFVLECLDKTAEEAVLHVLNNEMYDSIVL